MSLLVRHRKLWSYLPDFCQQINEQDARLTGVSVASCWVQIRSTSC